MSKTHVIADGITQVRMMLTRWYDEGNVFSVQAVMDEYMAEGTKTLTAPELQVKSLTDRAKQLNQQTKEPKARQSLEKAQAHLQTTYQ